MYTRIGKLSVFLLLIVFALGLSACGGSAEKATEAAPTLDLNATAQVMAEQAVAQTQAAQAPASLPTEAVPTEVVPTEAAPTEAAPTAETAKDLPEAVKSVFTGTPVSYSLVGDFDQSWAQIGYYQWTSIENPPTNFVIRTDATWTSASETANWDQSGCGFAFHAQDAQNHYIAFLGLDGVVYVGRLFNGEAKTLATANYGKVDVPQGSAELTLMVSGDKIYFFVNGEQVYSGSDSELTGSLKSGELGLTLVSGTNKDYGIRCQMANIDLWDLGK